MTIYGCSRGKDNRTGSNAFKYNNGNLLNSNGATGTLVITRIRQQKISLQCSQNKEIYKYRKKSDFTLNANPFRSIDFTLLPKLYIHDYIVALSSSSSSSSQKITYSVRNKEKKKKCANESKHVQKRSNDGHDTIKCNRKPYLDRG